MDTPRFRLLAVGTEEKYHAAIAAATAPILHRMADEHGFAAETTNDASVLNDANLSRVDVLVVSNLAPFDIAPEGQAAIQRFVESGKGWVGLHAAGLTGRFGNEDGPYWDWFEAFLGGVTYSPHPAYQTGAVTMEDRTHPATRNLPERFEIGDEWYEFDRSPRGAVRVLATADESTYRPNKPMGDHPMVWTNEDYRRMIYLAIGHDPSILENDAYLTLLKDAILWAGDSGNPLHPRGERAG